MRKPSPRKACAYAKRSRSVFSRVDEILFAEPESLLGYILCATVICAVATYVFVRVVHGA